MNMYQMPPSPHFGRGEHLLISAGPIFDDAEIQRIIDIGNGLPQIEGEVGDNVQTVIPEVRSAGVSWIGIEKENAFIYERLIQTIMAVNGQYYGFDLFGFAEKLQFTTYKEGDHYIWHDDLVHASNMSPRKLSLTVQLTDPSEYDGGELELRAGGTGDIAKKDLGVVSIFPSFYSHCVRPVTRGVRRSLVAWVSGPAFR